MHTDPESLLTPALQSALAEQAVAAAIAVVSGAATTDATLRMLDQQRRESLQAPQQHGAAAALQAWAAEQAAQVFLQSLDPQGAGQTQAESASLRQSLETAGTQEVLEMVRSRPESAPVFLAATCTAIAGKCADLLAAEVERNRTGPLQIHNEEDARVFEERHRQHQQQRTRAAVDFLSGLPERFPQSGARLFREVRRSVQARIEQEHKRPAVHQELAGLFDQALAAMPPQRRDEIASQPAG